jgi:hypothetical protein
MKVSFTRHPFAGERVILTSPEMSVRISEEWFSRPHLYTGRALTADTLVSKTKHHLRHLQLSGRHLSRGIIQGLTLSAYRRPHAGSVDAELSEQWLSLTAGLGMTSWGEDVTLPETGDILLDHVLMWEKEGPPRGAGIFVLQPLEILDEVVADPNSQCQWDEERDPFEDEQIVDGCRLVFFPWPEAVLGPIPAADPLQFRNRLAYRIFDYERERPDAAWPWERIGVPLGLVYIAVDTGEILFIDQQAVARQGGAPLSTKPLLTMNGTPFLWESRIQQFIGHLYDLRQNLDQIPSAHAYFDVLPPVGVLPKQALNFDSMSTEFFPSQFIIDAAPIPEEQLEVAMNGSAGLAPFDLYQPEKIKLLVPVPQAVYEPDLLKKEEPDPLFLETLRKLVREIRQWLADRTYVRSMAPRVIGAMDVGQITQFVEDSDAVPDEEKFPTEVFHHAGITDFGERAQEMVKDLHDWIKSHAPGVPDPAIALLLPTGKPPLLQTEFKGLENFLRNLQNNIKKTEDLLSTGYVKAEADMYRLRQLLLGNIKSSRLATSPAMAQIVSGQTGQPTPADVESFFKAAAAQKPGPVAAESAPGPITEGRTDAEGLISPLAFKYTSTLSKTYTDIGREMIREKPLIDRIYESPSMEVKSGAVNTKTAIFESLAEIPFSMDDKVTVVGSGQAILKKSEFEILTTGLDNVLGVIESRFSESREWVVVSTLPLTAAELENLGGAKEGEKVEAFLNNIRNKKEISLTDLKNDPGLGQNIRESLFDPDPPDGDEADYFTAGVTALEHGMNAMRLVEKRLDDYKKTFTQGQKVLALLRLNGSRWQDKLGEIDAKLLELRHDALVTRSLFEEERARIAAINDRRRAILDTYVTSLVFVRPRLVEARLDVPSVPLHGEYVNPVPACLAEDFEATGELAEMLEVFRNVPVAWLTEAKGLVRLVNDPASMVDMMQQASARTTKITGDTARTASPQAYNTHEYGKVINKIIAAHQQHQETFVKQKALEDSASLNAKTWVQLVDQAESQISLGDLIARGKGFSKLAVKAAEIVENLEDVAVSLYHLCNELPPVVRLQWANLISIYDRPVDLRHLEALPGFDKLDHTLRRDQQNMVDWLFSQVNTGIDQARQTMNDLVRVCILLASHAPVSTIVKGYVNSPSKGKVGDFIDIVVQQGLVKIGMVATIFTGETIGAQGVVTDVGEKAARVKVTQATGTREEFNIDRGSQVKFVGKSVTVRA